MIRLFIVSLASLGAWLSFPHFFPALHHSAWTFPLNGAAVSISWLMIACALVAYLAHRATSGKKSRR